MTTPQVSFLSPIHHSQPHESKHHLLASYSQNQALTSPLPQQRTMMMQRSIRQHSTIESTNTNTPPYHHYQAKTSPSHHSPNGASSLNTPHNHHHHHSHYSNNTNTHVHTNPFSISSVSSSSSSSPLLQFEINQAVVRSSSSPNTYTPLLQPQHVVTESPTIEKLPNLNELMNGENHWPNRPLFEPQFTKSPPHLLPPHVSHMTSPPHYQPMINQHHEPSSSMPQNHNSCRSQHTSNSNESPILEGLERRVYMQEQEIRRLHNENAELKRELERLYSENSPRLGLDNSHSTSSNRSSRMAETSPTSVKQLACDGHVSASQINTKESKECSKKRKSCDTLTKQPPQSKKQVKSDIRNPQQHPTRLRNTGRRDATVGDLEKYTVTWKGEKYVLVNAFKNRTQILNYYVPLFENNFPDKVCKLVLCNDEYKTLSTQNPVTVEKKKHAWRVSVFTMDFYNFVKNFDKKNLKIINSSAGFIPNIYFEEPQPSSSTATPTTDDASSLGTNSSTQSTHPALVTTPTTSNTQLIDITTPRPIANINNKQPSQ
ncbi:hypothetical protein FDP41_003939 [Naegleria fowleri]|uniref:Uncharacterized protein n=1 Tax=Naegleria fowleri TaxID=5763 RepID=A0A6A5BQF5_NAEFO|nr:uncharacterized protein FDP41_003939 [Naegleria fowleri]KAF0977286.1 hypothetical protein FDP41_003939 [Naegleria fowleri]